MNITLNYLIDWNGPRKPNGRRKVTWWITSEKELSQMHPEAQKHQQQREAQREVERIKQANLELWTKSLNLRFVHVREPVHQWTEELSIKGGMTIAYSLPKPNYKRLIPIAVSYVHPNDTFCKREGRYYAAREFYNGRKIDIRIPKDYTPATFIKTFFEGLI